MEMGETYRRINITATLHQSGLDGKVTKLKLLLSKDTRNPDFNLQKYTQITLRVWKNKWSGLMNLNFLIPVWGKPSTTYPNGEAWWWQHHAVGVFFSGRDWGSDSEHSEPQTALKVHLTTWQLIRTQPRQCRSGLGTTLWTSSSGPATAGT